MPIIACFLLVSAVNLEWVLQGLQRLPAIAVSRLVGQVAFGACMPLLLAGGLAGATRYADANLLGLAIAALAVIVLLRRGALPLYRVRCRELSSRLVRSLPFAWSLVMIQIYYSIDTLMLGYLGNSAQVGEYGIAYRLPQSATTLIAVWVVAQYPALAARATSDRTAIAASVGLAASLGSVLALSFLLVTPVSHSLMTELFGAAFRPAGTPFLILMANAGVILVSINFGNTLLALGDERRASLGLTLGAALNVALNFLLIPRFGPTGAACATLATEMFILVYMYRRCLRVLGPVVVAWSRLFRGLAAFAPSLLATVVLGRLLPALIAVVIAGVLYLALSVQFGALPVAALRPVRRQ
jgi:O-antigen/teichoic acid export membrane protein